MRVAFCWRSGEIEFAKDWGEVPEGAIDFLENVTMRPDLSDDQLVDLVKVKARLAYDNETFLVPGVPEAECDVSAADALRLWVATSFEPPLAVIGAT